MFGKSVNNGVNTAAGAGGAGTYKLIAAASVNSNNIKATAGRVYGYVITNIAAAARSVKLYNKATAPTVGTDVPISTITIPANGVMAFFMGDVGETFSVGIGIGITVNPADTDATAVTAGDVIANIFYA